MLYRLVLHPWTLGHDLLSGTPRAHPSTCRLGFRVVCLEHVVRCTFPPEVRHRSATARRLAVSWHDAKGFP